MHTNTHTERERHTEQERARKNMYSGMNSLNSIFNGILLYFVYSRHTQKSIELTMHINVTIGVACCVCVCVGLCVCILIETALANAINIERSSHSVCAQLTRFA